MTAKLSDEQKKYYRELAETSLNDVCVIHRYEGETKDEYNDITHSFTDLPDIPCGFSVSGTPFQREISQPVILQFDGILRVKLSQPLDIKDDVTVRGKRYNVDNVWDGLTLRMASLKSMDTE